MRLFFWISTLVNLTIPGTGFALIGAYRHAGATHCLFVLSVVMVCWSRWIFEPEGWLALLLLFLVLHTISIYHLLSVMKHRTPGWRWRNIGIALAFVSVVLGAVYYGFMTKDRWLGLHFFYVPSQSMQPTLMPGDFILIDTWAYGNAAPEYGDIAVFTRASRPEYLVKRVSQAPNKTEVATDHYYMTGDNPSHSTDSRQFGTIPRDRLIGPARMVLFALDRQLKPVAGRWLIEL